MKHPFYPPLLAIVPVVLVYSVNAALLPIGELPRPLLVSLLIALLIWGGAALAFRSAVKGAALTGLLILGALAYSKVQPFLPFGNTVQPWIYSAVVLAIAIPLALRAKSPQIPNVFALALLLLSMGQFASALRQPRPKGSAVGGKAVETARPDIYYIILDGFGRQDSLKTIEGFDDAFFIDGLRKLGFYVADRSRANYVQTELSLASSLNMEHLRALLPNADPQTENRSLFDSLIVDNAVAKTLVQNEGYRFLTVTTGFPAIQFPANESGYTPRGGLSLLENALIDLTPLRANDTVNESQFIARRRWLKDAFSSLQALAGGAPKPRFIFAHVLAPHPPFVFDADGNPVEKTQGFGYYDGSDFMDRGGNRAQYQKGYRGQATWIAKQTLATVAEILRRSPNPPVIIVQGDHGPKSELQQNSLEGTNLQECVPNLNAYYVPDAVRARLYPEITPVNSFRIVLSELFGLDLPKRPDTSYFSPFAKPLQLTDVTDRIR